LDKDLELNTWTLPLAPEDIVYVDTFFNDASSVGRIPAILFELFSLISKCQELDSEHKRLARNALLFWSSHTFLIFVSLTLQSSPFWKDR
jgi:hypothetical protein